MNIFRLISVGKKAMTTLFSEAELNEMVRKEKEAK
jgi:hypothetical protein